jgi:outer membrane protein TolC
MKRPLRNLSRFFMIGLALGLSGQALSALTLNEYLQQVQGQNLSYKGTTEQSEAAALKSREADLIFTPRLFAEGRVGSDGKPSSPPVFVYDELRSQSYLMGVSQQFRFGLQTKLYYEADRTEFAGANFGPGIPIKYWDASPKVELSLPVWGGGFGRSAEANEEITRQQNAAEQFSNQAQSLSYLAGAEAAYWKLSAWQDVVRIQEKALKAAEDILNYVTRKKNMNLGEQSDIVQARALFESRTLELQLARNERRAAERDFNTYMNRPAETPVENLQPIDFVAIEALPIPQSRPGERYDVKATAAQLSTAQASSRLVNERNKPSLEVYGNYALNGRDDQLNTALQNAYGTAHDTSLVGFRFNMPLNLSASGDAKAGALKAERAAEYNRQFSQFSQEQDWINLTRNLADARDNLRLLGKIENVQKTKVENERSRLKQGRTTTYQVLLFEQDYSQSSLTRVKSAANILGLYSQIKLYQAGK